MRKQCAVCAAGFEAKRTTAKYCSARCRVRASREAKPVPQPEAPSPGGGSVWQATLAELTAAGRADCSSGRAALALALRIDLLAEPGASLAAMVREHRAALADALKGGRAEVNPLDELRARRERKFAAGG